MHRNTTPLLRIRRRARWKSAEHFAGDEPFVVALGDSIIGRHKSSQVVARMVDRGDPASATSDIGAMELFAQPVVAFDPWRLAEVVRDA